MGYGTDSTRCRSRRSRACARHRLGREPSVHSVHVSPGNAGTAEIATNHAVSAGDVDGQVALAQRLGADLVVVGPEAPLVAAHPMHCVL